MIPMLAWGIENSLFTLIISENSANKQLDDWIAPLLDAEIDVEDIAYHLSPFPRLKVFVPFINNTPLLEGCKVKFDMDDANSIFGSVEINTDIPIKSACIIKKGKFDFIPNP